MPDITASRLPHISQEQRCNYRALTSYVGMDLPVLPTAALFFHDHPNPNINPKFNTNTNYPLREVTVAPGGHLFEALRKIASNGNAQCARDLHTFMAKSTNSGKRWPTVCRYCIALEIIDATGSSQGVFDDLVRVYVPPTLRRK